MLEPDEVAARGIQKSYVMKCVGETDQQRHEHDDADQQHRRQGVEIRFSRQQHAAPTHAAPIRATLELTRCRGHLPLSCFCLALVR